MTSQQIIPESMKTSIIRICSYDDKNLKGTFYNQYYSEEIAFGNLTRLLLLMEDMMNSMDCPQSSVRSRRFGKEAKIPEKNSMVQQQKLDKPVIATFTVNKYCFVRSCKLAGETLLARRKARENVPQRIRINQIVRQCLTTTGTA